VPENLVVGYFERTKKQMKMSAKPNVRPKSPMIRRYAGYQASIHDAIRLCLSVVREDEAKPTSGVPEVEIIEARTSDFLETR
jgi:lipoate-protein ligase A